MDEYIEKKKLVNSLKMWLMDLENDMDKGDYGELCENKGAREAVESCICEVEEQPVADVKPVDRWISCKDKMPEDNTLVLFVYVSKNGVKSVHYGYHQTLKGLGSSWAKPSGGWHYYDDDITHWQPLPEPPKDGDAND